MCCSNNYIPETAVPCLFWPTTLLFFLILLCTAHLLIPIGVSCPRAPRDDATPGDMYGQQALIYIKELIMQREVGLFANLQHKMHGCHVQWPCQIYNMRCVDAMYSGLVK